MKIQELKKFATGIEAFDIEKDGKAVLQQKANDIQKLQREGKTFDQICERLFLPELKKKYFEKLGFN